MALGPAHSLSVRQGARLLLSRGKHGLFFFVICLASPPPLFLKSCGAIGEISSIVFTTCLDSLGLPFNSSIKGLIMLAPQVPHYSPCFPLQSALVAFLLPFDQWPPVSLTGPTLRTLALFTASCLAFSLAFRPMAQPPTP